MMHLHSVLRAVNLIALITMAPKIALTQPVKNVVPVVARPLPLTDVRVTGGPIKLAQDLNAKYLLQLEPDRMMAYYRMRAGLKPKASGYDGWDGDGKNLTGHIAGHYLSAVSHMYAATGDIRFKERADYLVREMKEVQEKHGDGYLGALEQGREKFAEVRKGEIRSSGFDLNGLWAPWYTLHKTFAGLRDAYRLTGNKDALEIEVKFAEWAESIVSPLDEAQVQKMLQTEFGGMNEVLIDLYVDTSSQRWLDLSNRFEHRLITAPLQRQEDNLNGLHGNTQIPKILGSLARYIYTGNRADGIAAGFFWDTVVNNHSFATGGHGKDEYFGPPGKLSARTEGRTNESCNVYNMLKMSRELFAIQPLIKYPEFQERALFNHVLGSIDPTDGSTCYMVPVGRNVRREYQDLFHSFTCCVGTGMENHAMHGEGIYYEGTNKLWVNLYIPSTGFWRTRNLEVIQKTDFPEGETASLEFRMKKAKTFTLSLRRPSWAGQGFILNINGKEVKKVSYPSSYIEIDRTWKSGDVISLKLPKALHELTLPDNANRAALMVGPLVLSGEMEIENSNSASPVFVSQNRPVTQQLEPLKGKNNEFRAIGIDTVSLNKSRPVHLVPFYRLHRKMYTTYWDIYSPLEWKQKSADIVASQEQQRKLEAATIAFVQLGEMQPERDYNQQGEATEPTRVAGRAGRRGSKWFSFDMPVDPTQPAALVVTYNTEEWRTRTFEILVDNQRLAEQKIERRLPGQFMDVQYPIPAEMLQGKNKVTVRFQATNGNEIAAVFGLRIITMPPA